MKPKSSVIHLISIENLKELVTKSTSFHNLFQNLGIHSGGARGQQYTNLKQRLIENQIDYMHFSKGGRIQKVYTDDIIFSVSSNISKSTLKQRLKTKVPYKCNQCGCNAEWNNKPLSLQIDHKNGISNDNRLENLRFLCPNCHSQTETYAGKHKRKPIDILKQLENKRQKIEINSKKVQSRIQLVTQSSIAFNKFGWCKELSQILNVSPQNARRWIIRNMPEFYQQVCFKTIRN